MRFRDAVEIVVDSPVQADPGEYREMLLGIDVL